MKIFLSIKKSSGYTLIEILISLFIMVLILGVVQSNYRQFILNKSLDAARSGVISDLRLAQEYALAGRKASCAGIDGYEFRFNSTTNATIYTIRVKCGATYINVKTVSLSSFARGVSANVTPQLILFKPLGMGTDLASGTNFVIILNQQTSASSRTITVTPGGEIK